MVTMKDEVSKQYSVKFKVPFHDVDPMQVVWHGNYLKYFEIARSGLFESLGIDLYNIYLKSGYLFPIIRSAIKYIYPLRYNDEFICSAAVVEVRRKIIVDFEIRLASNNILCARGRTEQAAVKIPGLKMELTIPDEIQKALIFKHEC
jgi:acyl-CoA thioester hydrolase